MKKHLIAITALLLLFKISNAQTEKGTQNLGLNMSIGYLKVTNSSTTPASPSSQKNTSFNIGPDYSFFIANNVDLGFTVNYNSQSQEYGTNVPDKQVSHGYGAGVYLRKYFLYNGKIGLRTGARFNYGHINSNYTAAPPSNIYNYSVKGNSYGGGLGLELVAYPAKKLGVAAALAGLSYSHTKQTSDNYIGDTELSSFTFNTINNGLTMSVFYVLGSK